MKNKFPIALISFALVASACKNESQNVDVKSQKPLLERADWLLGRWEAAKDGTTMIEEWKKENDSVYDGFSVVISGKDTVFNETISLEQQGENLHYIVRVSGQNEEKPVSFKLSLERDDELRFENMKHDYPKVILYKNPTPDSLVASISGKGGEKEQFFRFKKVK